jgi:hypothetical protein
VTHGHSSDPFRGFFYVSESVGFTTKLSSTRRPKYISCRGTRAAPLLGGGLGSAAFFMRPSRGAIF